MKKEYLSNKLKEISDLIGIDALGFAEAFEFSTYAIKNSKRRDPKLTLPNAKTIIVTGIYIGGVTLPKWTNHCYGRTSRLYLSEFFLDVVKPLEPIIDLIKKEGYQAIVCKSGSNLPLKLAAVRAGLGWQGKHSLLISKKYGSFLALGGIITDAELIYNHNEEPNLCRSCDKCQKSCPLGALHQPYVLNKKKCMSNLLMSEKLTERVKNKMENRVIDCEICQDVCPWNRKHLNSPLDTYMTKSFQKKIEKWESFFYLPDLIKLTEKEYKERLNPLNTGIPFNIFHRNALLAFERIKKNEQMGK